MRKPYRRQYRFGATTIAELQLNVNCRDEIVPLLVALKHVYMDSQLRNRLTKWIATDLNEGKRRDTGRPGLDDWQVLVLAAIRMNCDLDYDKLQDLAENHRALRTMLDVDGWDQDVSFDYRRLRNTLCRLQPETLKKINQEIVRYGQAFAGDAASTARADSFVIETNIHYPTESSLMYDGMRKVIALAQELSSEWGVSGWRQAKHLLRSIKKLHRQINQLSASRIVKKKDAIDSLYVSMIDRVSMVLDRARKLQSEFSRGKTQTGLSLKAEQLGHWIDLTDQVRGTAYRRIVLGEKVPNDEKLFSLFETHTQLYQRGKAGEPVQYGRLVMIFEDGAGFISHYHLADREATDLSMVIEQTAKAKRRHGGQLKSLSLDRGFHSAENVEHLCKMIDDVSCPSRNSKQYAEEVSSETASSRRRRHRHSGVESAIGALQRGNGLKRCRDRSEIGMRRYLGMAVLGRNLQVLGKLLIAREAPDSLAATSVRQAVA
jgi:IS5 family transposase